MQSISKDTIRLVADSLPQQNAGHMAIMVLAEVANTQGVEVAKYDDVIIKGMRTDSMRASQGGPILVTLSNLSKVSSASESSTLKFMRRNF